MISFLRKPPRNAALSKEALLPPGIRVYAIGDIHGRLDLLTALGEDCLHLPSLEPIAVFLGDYIDRGPDSAGVIEKLANGDFPVPIVALRGNHEATLLRFLEDETALDEWRLYGGLETLVSYGIDVKNVMRGAEYAAAQAALREALPPKHLSFFKESKLSWSAGDYFFCHAGIRPNIALARQQEHDLLWIRQEFNDYQGPHEKIIVHGHTPVVEPEVLPNRINLDTGAYATGILTCLALEGRERKFIATTRAMA